MFDNLINKAAGLKENKAADDLDDKNLESAGHAQDDLDISKISKDEFRQLFRRPKNGSILMKLKAGDMSGKNAGRAWEDVVSDVILVSQAKNINTSLYLISRMVLGHNSAAMFAENAQTLMDQGVKEEVFLKHMMDDTVSSWNDVGPFLKSILPYHKDVILKHSSLFSKLAGMR